MKAPDAFRTISEVAEELDLPQHVLRFWETRFNQIKPLKRGGGRRYYRPEDVDLLRGIRLLLYSEGFTIRGVQRLLKEKGVAFVAGVGQSGSVQTVSSAPDIESGSPARPSRPPARRPEPETAPAAEVPDRGLETPVPTGGDAALPKTVAPAQLPGGAIVLTLEKRRRIETALADLLEAKRLLDQVR